MQNGACEKGKRHCAGVERGYARLSSLLRAKREPEKHQRFRRAGPDGLRYPASTSCLGRHSCPADRGPNSSSLFPPQAAVVAVARKGLLAPFRPRRGCRNGKKLVAALRRVAAPSVCFAAARILLAAAPTAPPCFRHWRRSSLLRIFWASPVYGSADGVTLSQNFTFSKGVKSAAKQQIGETRKKR